MEQTQANTAASAASPNSPSKGSTAHLKGFEILPCSRSAFKALQQSLSLIWFSYDKEHPESERLFCLNYLYACMAKSDLMLTIKCAEKICGAIMCTRAAQCKHAPSRFALSERQRRLFARCSRFYDRAIARDVNCAEGSAYHYRYRDNYKKLRELTKDAKRKSEIVLLFTDPKMQGRGLGRALLEAAEAELLSCGSHELFLLTDVNCNWGLYPHVGYVRTQTVRLDFSAVKDSGEYVFDCFIYEKALKA